MLSNNYISYLDDLLVLARVIFFQFQVANNFVYRYAYLQFVMHYSAI